MKKLIIALLVIFTIGAFCACGDAGESENSEAAKEVTIMDCVDDISVEGIEDGVIYWNVKFNEQFNDESFDGLDFYEVIKECLGKDESKDAAITDYSIIAYDSNDMLRFAWGVPDPSYDPIHEYDENGNPIEPEYQLTKDMYDELLEVSGK